MTENKKLGTSEKIDVMFEKMFLDDNCLMVRVGRIEDKLDNECPVGRKNMDCIKAICAAGSIVTGAIFSVIGYFHWWGKN